MSLNGGDVRRNAGSPFREFQSRGADQRKACGGCKRLLGGRKSPTACRYRNHWQSETSVRRPGTFWKYRALTGHTSNPWVSRIWNSGIQYTPVDSMATVSIPQDVSQSANRWKSSVNVGNDRTGSGSRSG